MFQNPPGYFPIMSIISPSQYFSLPVFFYEILSPFEYFPFRIVSPNEYFSMNHVSFMCVFDFSLQKLFRPDFSNTDCFSSNHLYPLDYVYPSYYLYFYHLFPSQFISPLSCTPLDAYFLCVIIFLTPPVFFSFTYFPQSRSFLLQSSFPFRKHVPT